MCVWISQFVELSLQIHQRSVVVNALHPHPLHSVISLWSGMYPVCFLSFLCEWHIYCLWGFSCLVLCRRWVAPTQGTFPSFLHKLLSLQLTPWCSTPSLSMQVRGPGFRCGEWRTWSWFLFQRVFTEGSTAETLTWFSTAPRTAEEACSTTCTTGKVLHYTCSTTCMCTFDFLTLDYFFKFYFKNTTKCFVFFTSDKFM